jgi:protein-L-isoaspartate(D-aspartate) O-methyltransferase
MDERAKELVSILKAEGISDPRVLSAFEATPRHLFVPDSLQAYAYYNDALPIGEGQTISQPYVVARMTEALLTQNQPHKVLEVGTGSGYQAAILAKIFDEVYTIERIKPLLDQAKLRFAQLHLNNIQTRFSDGTLGWPEHGPYNGIIVTAATDKVPNALLEQLAEKGRMIIPVGTGYGQELQVLIRHGNEFAIEHLDSVIFVPLLRGTKN